MVVDGGDYCRSCKAGKAGSVDFDPNLHGVQHVVQVDCVSAEEVINKEAWIDGRGAFVALPS